MRCEIYTRIATDNKVEKEFNSCETQEAEIKSFILSQDNMEIYKVYSGRHPRANLNKPAAFSL